MKLVFIQTGGTIDKDYPKTTKGYVFEISEPAIKRIVQRVAPNFDFEIVSVLKKDSLDITEADRIKISKTCQEVMADKIIITHGTDTMIETAKALSNIKNKVIILTGAARPEKFSDSDASFNLGVAIGAANVLKKGIYIAMNGRIYPWNNVKRKLETGQFIDY
ncbi:MAG: asparaginase domain-containing protein [Nanoarchaeota archaeon]|nr:asparaginase [Nanoarchaeota archaeon]MBU4300141.1 asparaginase [Nanoarchaeota archaeon]MBU4451575.1 asparaginase [Nanoarchaeota archaeon]MCG2724347.1 asparaginase domain-containing protein [archaeon]